MAIKLYQTRGLLIKSLPIKESSRSFLVLTSDLGLIWATAQGVREHKSKLRANLQVGRLVQLELVRGRESWRIIGAQESRDVWLMRPANRLALGRILGLMVRLTPPEESNFRLYRDILTGLNQVHHQENGWETLLVLRLLHYLGYCDPAPHLSRFVVAASIDRQLLSSFRSREREAVNLINQALAASHL